MIRSGRSLHKEWKNGRYLPKWTVRIRWYENGDDIRLEMLDCERELNIYPATRADADHIWFMFKQGAPAESERKPIVADLLKLLVNEGGKWRPRKPNEGKGGEPCSGTGTAHCGSASES